MSLKPLTADLRDILLYLSKGETAQYVPPIELLPETSAALTDALTDAGYNDSPPIVIRYVGISKRNPYYYRNQEGVNTFVGSDRTCYVGDWFFWLRQHAVVEPEELVRK